MAVLTVLIPLKNYYKLCLSISFFRQRLSESAVHFSNSPPKSDSNSTSTHLLNETHSAFYFYRAQTYRPRAGAGSGSWFPRIRSMPRPSQSSLNPTLSGSVMATPRATLLRHSRNVYARSYKLSSSAPAFPESWIPRLLVPAGNLDHLQSRYVWTAIISAFPNLQSIELGCAYYCFLMDMLCGLTDGTRPQDIAAHPVIDVEPEKPTYLDLDPRQACQIRSVRTRNLLQTSPLRPR